MMMMGWQWYEGGFSLEFSSPRQIANQGWKLHLLLCRFCLETYQLLDELPSRDNEPHLPAWNM